MSHMPDTETHCHCGAAYNQAAVTGNTRAQYGGDHCAACGCEQYESLRCHGRMDAGTGEAVEDD